MAPALTVRPEAGAMRREQEMLEKPRSMRKVPAYRAGIGHALHHHVLDRQRRNQVKAGLAHAPVMLERRFRFDCVSECVERSC